MLAQKPVVFPLHPIVRSEYGSVTCGCGKVDCRRIGSHAAIRWGELTSESVAPAAAPGAGFGICTGARSGIVVIDTDSSEADAWLNSQGVPSTFKVRTGSGRGHHYYFVAPSHTVKNSVGVLAPQVDVRGDGGMVVAPGSPHKSGGFYEVVCDASPAQLPAWLADRLRPSEGNVEAVGPYAGDVAPGDERNARINAFADYLRKAPPSIEGQGGDGALFKVVQHGAYDLRLDTPTVLSLVRDIFDPRCSPPWGDALEARVTHHCHGAKTQSSRAANEPFPHDFWDGIAAPEPTAANDYGFTLVNDWAATPIPPRYLVANTLLEGAVTLIYGDSGGTKSWVTLSLALAVATGMPWLQRYDALAGPVLYVDFEDGKAEFHRRVHLLNGARACDNLWYVYHPGRLDDGDLWSRLADLVSERGIKLVVLDTLNGGMAGEDENDVRFTIALQAAGKFCEGTGCAAVVVHHANKTGQIRGSSAIKANADTVLKLETVSVDDENGVHRSKLTNEKSSQRKTAPVYLELSDDGMVTFETEVTTEEREEKERVMTYDELRAKVLLVLQGEAAPITSRLLREKVACKMNNLSTVLDELRQQEKVVSLTSRHAPRGYTLDDEGKRLARVKAACERYDWTTDSALAEAADVDRLVIVDLLRSGTLCRKSSSRDVGGYFIP